MPHRKGTVTPDLYSKKKTEKNQNISNYLEKRRTGEGERKGVMKVEQLDGKKKYN